MKRAIIIAAMLSATGLAGAQMFAQLFGATGTPIKAVAWYKLDGNALDSSGNGYDGTWSGTEAYTNGPFAGTQAGRFAGDGSAIASPPIPDIPDKSYTAAFWMRYSQNSGVYSVLHKKISNSSSTNPGVAHILDAANSSRWFITQVYDGTVGANHNSAATTYTAGEWVHVTITVSLGDSLRVYRNAQLVSSKALSSYLGSMQNNESIRIGSSLGAGPLAMTGDLADVRIYDRALSEDNIARIMESQDNEPLEELQ